MMWPDAPNVIQRFATPTRGGYTRIRLLFLLLCVVTIPASAQQGDVDTVRSDSVDTDEQYLTSTHIWLNRLIANKVTRPRIQAGLELGRSASRTSGADNWLYLPSTRMITTLSGEASLSLDDGRFQMSTQGGTSLSATDAGGFLRGLAAFGSRDAAATHVQWIVVGDLARMWTSDHWGLRAQGISAYYGVPTVLQGGLRMGSRERFGINTPVITGSLVRRWNAKYGNAYGVLDIAFRGTQSRYNVFELVTHRGDVYQEHEVLHHRTRVVIGDLSMSPQITYGAFVAALDATFRFGRGAAIWDDPALRNELGSVVGGFELPMRSEWNGALSGMRRDRNSRLSVLGRVMWMVTSNVTVVGESGRLPSDPLFGGAAVRYSAISIRMNFFHDKSLSFKSNVSSKTYLGISSLKSVAINESGDDNGRREIVISGIEAQTVEISADFTEWKARSLSACGVTTNAEATPRKWCGIFVIPPGAHQLLVRVDGGQWQAPPGMPAVEDGFGSKAGLFVAP